HLVLENMTCRMARRIACVSRAVARFTTRHAHVPASRITVVPNGIEVDSVRRVLPVERSSLGLRPDMVVAVCVGRLEYQKGIDVLLRALALARADAANLYVLVVGRGPLERPLRALAGQLDLESRVRFLGWRDDVPA